LSLLGCRSAACRNETKNDGAAASLLTAGRFAWLSPAISLWDMDLIAANSTSQTMIQAGKPLHASQRL